MKAKIKFYFLFANEDSDNGGTQEQSTPQPQKQSKIPITESRDWDLIKGDKLSIVRIENGSSNDVIKFMDTAAPPPRPRDSDDESTEK